MANGAGINTNETPSNPSPLWIIALFIALCQVMAGVAVAVTDGPTRMIFAIFAVTFPFVVLTVFVWLLLKHPGNLYSPSQYTNQTTIETYVTALSRQNRANSIVYTRAIGEAIARATEGDALAGAHTPEAWRAQIAETIDLGVKSSSIIIDRSAFFRGADGAEPLQIPVTEESSVGELLDSTFFAIAPAVEPYHYAKTWILVDEHGAPLEKVGTKWVYRDAYSRDERLLSEVGLGPGSKLILRRL